MRDSIACLPAGTRAANDSQRLLEDGHAETMMRPLRVESYQSRSTTGSAVPRSMWSDPWKWMMVMGSLSPIGVHRIGMKQHFCSICFACRGHDICTCPVHCALSLFCFIVSRLLCPLFICIK